MLLYVWFFWYLTWKWMFWNRKINIWFEREGKYNSYFIKRICMIRLFEENQIFSFYRENFENMLKIVRMWWFFFNVNRFDFLLISKFFSRFVASNINMDDYIIFMSPISKCSETKNKRLKKNYINISTTLIMSRLFEYERNFVTLNAAKSK